MQTTQHLFANNENAILSLIVSAGNDEHSFAEIIGKALCGLRLDDWNNIMAESFAAKLADFIKTIEDYNKENHDQRQPGSRSYTITSQARAQGTRAIMRPFGHGIAKTRKRSEGFHDLRRLFP